MDQPTPPPFKPSPAATTDTAATPTGQPLPPSSSAPSTAYQNNPFFVAVDGISAFFKYAKTIAIIFTVLSVLGVLSNIASSIPDALNNMNPESSQANESMASPFTGPNFAHDQIVGIAIVVGSIIFVMGIVILLVAAIINGMRDVSAAAIAKQTELSFGNAVKTLARRFPGYLWLQVMIAVKVFLWSLLLVVPGVIMSIRYSLAGTAYFARDMKAGEALKHSTTITKGAWFTTFSSIGLFNLITLGFIQLLIEPSARGILFRQYDAYDQAHTKKPGAHWLSIAYFVLTILLAIVFLFLLAALFTFSAANYSTS